MTERGETKARLLSPGGWGVAGRVTDARYAQAARPTSRTRCRCGCNARATHVGMANGLALMGGCELYVARWVRDGLGASTAADGVA